MSATATRGRVKVDGPVSDDNDLVALGDADYSVFVTIEGTKMILFDAYNADEVEAKAALPKGHAGKKIIKPETQVYWTDEGNIAWPAGAMLSAIEQAARWVPAPAGTKFGSLGGVLRQSNPLSIREEWLDFGVKTWDAIDKRRVVLSSGGADAKPRPYIGVGWRTSFTLDVALPGVITPAALHESITKAGRLVGIGSFRKVYGRFHIIDFRDTIGI